MDIIDLIDKQYTPDDYIVLDVMPEELTYVPKLIKKKDNDLKIFHIREDSNVIKESIIQRIASAKKIPGISYEQYLVFNEKPSMSILKSCRLYRIGIYYKNLKGELELYAEPAKITGRKKKSQIPNTKIFFSSKQDLEERAIGKKIIDVQKDANKIPVFANLVEDDQRYDNTTENLIDIINDVMDDSDFVVCILAEEYRSIVDQEIRRALDLYEPEEILIFLKNNKTSKDAWAPLLNHIHTNYKVKYTEYLDMRDFELKFTRRLMVILKELHKKHDVEFLG
ncbi:hypothetical protein ACLI08_06405 [Flavobacterium sp. RNTU_13]|uniref:hypothetical protein n=1 Tax=Flavobacterium sp. RNTU_13 TaxID=3375145 RepID=UPI0039874691